jgi:Rv0078B-related antitoxin
MTATARAGGLIAIERWIASADRKARPGNRAILLEVDALRQDDIQWARQTPGGQKLALALSMMRFGIELKRTSLRASHPHATELEIEGLMRAWLEADD